MTQAPVNPTADPTPATNSPDETAELVVSCVKLSKTFRDFWLRPRARAVDQIDLSIRRGEVFGLLGPNGSGKSTTIKMILGLLHPTAGRVAVFGKLPSDVGTKKRIGYLPEESYLYRFLTAYETLEYYGRLFGLPGAIRKRRIETLLEMVGLTHVAHRPVGEFSKGMTRKVGLAQALINDPELLILDEPTSGMDPIATADVKRVIQQLRQRGKTILLCSHLLADVEDVTDRVAIMFGGKVREHGQVTDLLTVKHETTVTTGEMDAETEQRMVAALESAGISDIKIQHPRMRLEQLFLDIVHKAQSEGTATDGAVSGQGVAGFLAGEGNEASDPDRSTEAVLASLQKTDTPEPEPAPEPTQEVPAEAGDANVLSELSSENASAPEPKPSAETPSEQGPDDDADRAFLDELSGGR